MLIERACLESYLGRDVPFIPFANSSKRKYKQDKFIMVFLKPFPPLEFDSCESLCFKLFILK